MSPEGAAFARDVIARAGPDGRERAKSLLWAAGKLADYGTGLGLEAVPGVLLHPSSVERFTRCGRPDCGCHADPPRLHGPYHQWTRKKDGKTATRILSDDQL